jgi:hypothetical protein
MLNIKCKNQHGVNTIAKPSKQNNRHVLSMSISMNHVALDI